jgi:putative hydrolase
MSLDNAAIAELLAVESEKVTGHLQRAFRRAARAAFMWPEEAAELLAQNRSLTELSGVGPFLEKTIRRWIESPRPKPKEDPLRKDFLTLTAARRILARKPAFAKSYKGDLQMHSNWSDGSGTIADMAQAAIERGYEFIGITDHSKGLKIAGGIDEKQLEEQAEEIRDVNDKLTQDGIRFHVLRSIELNLNPRGQGDMEPEALQQLDLVVGSFHSSLRTTEDQTARYIAGLRNPHVHILGHPRGRVYNYRLGLKADWERVFAEAARLDKAVEIDSYPDRQDLNGSLLKLVRASGCRVAIDTDAHYPWQLAFVELGLAAALKAGIQPDRIVNFLEVKELLQWKASRD